MEELIGALLGGLGLNALISGAVRIPGHLLQGKFASMGNLSGKSMREIIAVAGAPSSISPLPNGKHLLQWMATGYHIAIIFNGELFEGVSHEFGGGIVADTALAEANIRAQNIAAEKQRRLTEEQLARAQRVEAAKLKIREKENTGIDSNQGDPQGRIQALPTTVATSPWSGRKATLWVAVMVFVGGCVTWMVQRNAKEEARRIEQQTEQKKVEKEALLERLKVKAIEVQQKEEDARKISERERAKEAKRIAELNELNRAVSQIEADVEVIPAGTLQKARHDGKKENTTVRINSFGLVASEISCLQWRLITSELPPNSTCGTADNSLGRVSIDDSGIFIRRLNAYTGGSYRLPTEIEKEWTCKYRHCPGGELTGFHVAKSLP